MRVSVVQGDLLEQDVEAIVNPWNRNFIPWWLLLPQGVSGAIKRRAGYAPFTELTKKGLLELGEAVETGSGKLTFSRIIHVAGLHAYWIASERSIRLSTTNAAALAADLGVRSLAYPIIGAGTGGAKQEDALRWMQAELKGLKHELDVSIVRYVPGGG